MIINKVMYRISKIMREIYYSYVPDQQYLSILENNLLFGLSIEPGNICNANCVFCAYQYQKRKKKIMPLEMFKKIIDDYNSIGGGHLGLCCTVGDPLVDPFILDRLHYARQFTNINSISTVTNCINLHEVGANNLLTSGLTTIEISTSGFDLKIHDEIYRSNKAEQMKNNIIKLLKMNRDLGNPCKIIVGLRTYQSLQEVLENPEFKEVAGLIDSLAANYYFDDWGGRIKSADLPKGMAIRPLPPLIMRRKNPCSMLYGGISIQADGTATLCGCRDVDGDSELVIGNIKDSSLMKLYRSEGVTTIRQNWLKGRKVPDICQGCRHYNSYTYNLLKECRIKVKH